MKFKVLFFFSFCNVIHIGMFNINYLLKEKNVNQEAVSFNFHNFSI